MLFVTGDTHGDFNRFSRRNFPQGRELGRDDCMIIAGDFGGIWSGEQEDSRHLDWLEDKPFTTLFVDGNHENFDLLNAYPEQAWHGGRVHVVRPHVLHLMRGQIFEIGGFTWFTMGGAASHDIEDGILDPADPDFERQYWRMRRQGAEPQLPAGQADGLSGDGEGAVSIQPVVLRTLSPKPGDRWAVCGAVGADIQGGITRNVQNAGPLQREGPASHRQEESRGVAPRL